MGWIVSLGLVTLSILALYSRHFGHIKIIKHWIKLLRVVVVLWVIGAVSREVIA